MSSVVVWSFIVIRSIVVRCCEEVGYGFTITMTTKIVVVDIIASGVGYCIVGWSTTKNTAVGSTVVVIIPIML